MKKFNYKLSSLGAVLIAAAFLLGVVASAYWYSSSAKWEKYLNSAYLFGVRLYGQLDDGLIADQPINIIALSETDAEFAENGAFVRIQNIPTPSLDTSLTIRDQSLGPLSGPQMNVAIISDVLRYPLAEIQIDVDGNGPEHVMGQLVRLIATYCSDAQIFAKPSDGRWYRISATHIYGCSAVPADYRLFSAILAALGLGILLSFVFGIGAYFQNFAKELKSRLLTGGRQAYVQSGPIELKEIVSAVNTHLQRENAQLSDRALILSGVSHDLGTPATRLRLRTALIKDEDLRDKIETDIDSMTEMIESVLSYTRAELSSEELRELSLNSLIEAVVDDFRDIGKPVTLIQDAAQNAEGQASMFTGRSRTVTIPMARDVTIQGRPILLKRAFNNLIENALKYGRRAEVKLVTTAEDIIFTVEDEGTQIDAGDMQDLIAPYKRGQNNIKQTGSGLGLTIAKTVAEQHGGNLYFENGARGLRSCISLPRRI